MMVQLTRVRSLGGAINKPFRSYEDYEYAEEMGFMLSDGLRHHLHAATHREPRAPVHHLRHYREESANIIF